MADTWLVEFPRLHALNRAVHKEWGVDADKRRVFLGHVEECIEALRKNPTLEREWEERRRDYFENKVFARGKAWLRNEARRPVEGREWRFYQRRLPRDGALDGVRHCGSFCASLNTVVDGKLQYSRHRCLADDGRLVVGAWCPPEVVKFDDQQLCQPPLPPYGIGRPYTLPEICFGFAVLHDAEGGIAGSFVPESHQLFTNDVLGASFGFWIDMVNGDGLSKTDAWADNLDLLFDRLRRELGEAGKSSASPDAAVGLPEVNGHDGKAAENAKSGVRADGKTDGTKNSWLKTPENPDVMKLHNLIIRNPDRQRKQVDIAREFTNNDETRAQSLLRKRRDWLQRQREHAAADG